MIFQEEYSNRLLIIDNIIKNYLPVEEGYEKTIIEAMNYSVLAGGKRVRPMLMLETYNYIINGKDNKDYNIDALHKFMFALECIHTYSLVHDDLPAMDNDVLRRGIPTTHVKYGHAMGILAGDALLNYAFEVASDAFNDSNDLECVMRALKILTKKPGIRGMIGGQVVDVENTGKAIDIDKLKYIHKLKTAALIEAAMMIGATLAGATEEQVNVFENVAYDIGMAFQIQDDVLDVVSTNEELGKPINSDKDNNKTTYVSIFGVDKAKEMVEEHSERAIKKLTEIDGENEFLLQFIEYLITRKK